jgi:hypothetical protein
MGNRVHHRMGEKWGTGDLRETESKLVESAADLWDIIGNNISNATGDHKEKPINTD